MPRLRRTAPTPSGLAHKHLPEMAASCRPGPRADLRSRRSREYLSRHAGRGAAAPRTRFPARPSAATAPRRAAPPPTRASRLDRRRRIRAGNAIAIEENAGTDRLTLRVCANATTGQVRLVATLDNLGKGASGRGRPEPQPDGGARSPRRPRPSEGESPCTRDPVAQLLLFGATGDLARRMLLPSLFNLHTRTGCCPTG